MTNKELNFVKLEKRYGADVRVGAKRMAAEIAAERNLAFAPRMNRDCLNNREWSDLRAAVEENLFLLQGQSLDDCVLILRILGVRCNGQVLEGLNQDLRVWKQPERRRLS